MTRRLRKLIPLLFLTLPLHYTASSQEQNITGNEQMLKEYLEQQKFPIDSTAKAVVLYEKGISFIANGTLEQRVERVVKILGDDAVRGFATINIPKGNYTSVVKIKGETYNLDNGTVNKQEIDRKDILKDEIDKSTTVLKFNLPSVKPGSVVHYTYTTLSPGFIFIPGWTFQDDYPVLESVYEINVPSYIVYTALERINVPMPKVDKQKELLTTPNASYQETLGNQTNHIWVRRNVPAFRKEPYMSSEDNFTERVKIHIEAYKGNLNVISFYNNWTSISKKFFYENKQSYGQVFSNNHFLQDKVAELTKGKTNALDKAKAIFSYVRSTIRARESMPGNRASDQIKEVYNKQEGSVEGVNLLLTAMLRSADLQSEPVLLGTKSNERLNDIYPDPDNIDYVVSKLTIDNTDYFLDAAIKQMPFGMLSPDCYNGYSRVVSEKGGYVYLEPDRLKNKTTLIITLAPSGTDSTKLLLKVDHQFGMVAALKYRKEWQDDSSAAGKMIRKNLVENTYPTTLNQYKISNLDNPDLPLSLHYEASIDFGDKAETIYFDPYIAKFYDKNPYTDIDRKYAVEMDYTEDINYVFHFQLPKGYEVDDYPKSTAFQFGDDKLISMKNIFSYEAESRDIALNSRLTTNTTLFHPDLYSQLRAFYEKVIEEQRKKIVLKKSHI